MVIVGQSDDQGADPENGRHAIRSGRCVHSFR